MPYFHKMAHRATGRLCTPEGSALVEFAIALPLLVVFIVGIFDFSGAFNTKLKLQHAAQLGAMVAAAQPTNDLDTSSANPGPDSLQPVATVIFNSLAADGVLPLANQGTCKAPVPSFFKSAGGVNWFYRVRGCSSDPTDVLLFSINRGVVTAGGAATSSGIGTRVQVHYPYHWRFNSAIQLLFPGSNSFAASTPLTEEAIVHNQT